MVRCSLCEILINQGNTDFLNYGGGR
ncbi:hypothetical protein RJ492_000787 [Pluralibacter gergoviae]|uniref:Uncharacterized protein n=1 Tax=Pluralibacter gergoviae TaxID=61647 RepID=A0AAI9GMK2_PLUGE|nr:hypothetical protein [Pluralibacter gergoviae]EKV0930839.1 hypothetical protein [Pluralibacter gergoviae]EKV6250084.1 hypothetical protein [Pluralibacter gergoviae]EKV9908741.1 hypothetical protein [Pluralibacter gergoviae]EKW6618875.1 hypothetical protein [Pluralibacter gergoviae]